MNEPKQLLDERERIEPDRGLTGANRQSELQPGALQVAATAFVVLFCIVGLALWGLPFYYDFMVQQFGWTRAQVTSGNALSKLVVGPVFGFIAGWIIDRFGPRRVMMAGILMAGGALVGLGLVSTLGMFYLFYFFNALGYVCGGPLPNQVLLSRWFDKSRGKAMGFAYLGIGIGGATVPWVSHATDTAFRLAISLAIAGWVDHSGVLSIGFPCKGGALPTHLGSYNERICGGDGSVQNPFLLPAHVRQYVFDCGGKRDAAESQTFPESRPPLQPGRCRTSSVARAVVQYRGATADGMAGRLLFEKICHAADLPAGRSRHPVSVPLPFARSPVCGGGSVRGRTGWRLHDHSLDDR